MTEKVNRKMQAPSNGTVPNPDPTERTVEQLLREIATSREIVESKATGDRNVFETRLGGMDTAIELLQKASDKIPQFIKDQVAQLQSLHEEKFGSISTQIDIQFGGIATQFGERDKRTEQLSLADKTAINAALAAQEKQAIAQNDANAAANAKMETNFAKLIDQGRELQQTMKDNTDVQINDIKSRLDKGEGGTKAVDRSTDRTSTVVGQVIAGAVAFVVIMSAIVGLVAFMATRAPAPVYLPAPPNAAAR